MVYTQHLGAACDSGHLRRNGSSQGHAKYQHKARGYQARFVPAATVRAARCAQVEKLLVERNSQRSIVRATGVSRMTMAKLAKKGPVGKPATAQVAAEQKAESSHKKSPTPSTEERGALP